MEDKILDNKKQELQLKDMYFKSIRFNQVRGAQGNVKLTIKHKFEFAKASDNESIRTTISTTISSDDLRIDMDIETVGIFKIDCSELIESKFAQIMVNIMYPNVRCEVQLLTTQPGIMPIMMPLMAPKVELRENDEIFG